MPRFYKFTLRPAALLFAIFAVMFACYASMRSESLRQQRTVARLNTLNAGYVTFQEDHQRRLGRFLGFDYPADEIMVVKGSESSEWGNVVGWICTDQDLQLLREFENLEKVYLRNSTYTDSGLRELASLPHATHVEFRFCNLQDADLTILATAQKLKRLNLYGCELQPGTAESIRQSFPGCEIDGIAK